MNEASAVSAVSSRRATGPSIAGEPAHSAGRRGEADPAARPGRCKRQWVGSQSHSPRVGVAARRTKGVCKDAAGRRAQRLVCFVLRRYFMEVEGCGACRRRRARWATHSVVHGKLAGAPQAQRPHIRSLCRLWCGSSNAPGDPLVGIPSQSNERRTTPLAGNPNGCFGAHSLRCAQPA